MGLPVPCGTTAHGTALGKAGKGIADASSMETVLKIVSRLASDIVSRGALEISADGIRARKNKPDAC
jgi:hypothetical protein